MRPADTATSNHPRTEVYLPCTSDEVRSWVDRVDVESPVSWAQGDDDSYVTTTWRPLHAGAELTFLYAGMPLHTIAIFGSPNEHELEIERRA